MSGGIYETLFPDGPAPAPVAAKKPVVPPKPVNAELPVTRNNPVSRIPPAVWKNLRHVSQLPRSWDIRHGFLLISLLIVGAGIVAWRNAHPPMTRRNPTPAIEIPKATATIPPPVPSHKAMAGSHIPATVTSPMASWPNFGNAVFNDAARAAPNDEFTDVRGLQQRLRAFGIFQDPASGSVDKATRKAFTVLASLSGQTVSDVRTAITALEVANSKAEGMLPYVGRFPLADEVPSWLLASLNENDLNAIGDKFNSVLDTAPGPFSLALTDPALELHGQLLADPERAATSLTCVGFTLLFAKGSLRHRVISRACRNPSSWSWRLART